jgi:23S rRNA pseudouridine2605 synthase
MKSFSKQGRKIRDNKSPGKKNPVGKNLSRAKGRAKEIPGDKALSGGIRLNRFIANTGLCSRREADELILAGSIKVNGKTVRQMGTRVGPADRVSYRDKPLSGERKIYVLLNKPRDCVTTVKDTHGRKTVMDLVEGCCRERIYPVGRLDRHTTGLLLLTNDGDLAEALSHPSDRALRAEDMQRLSGGLELDDGFIRPDRVEFVGEPDGRQLGMEIHSGRNRIVRRIFEQLGYRVTKLDRVYYAGLTKKGLPRGHWRHLSQKEVGMLKMSVPRKKPRQASDGN